MIRARVKAVFGRWMARVATGASDSREPARSAPDEHLSGGRKSLFAFSRDHNGGAHMNAMHSHSVAARAFKNFRAQRVQCSKIWCGSHFLRFLHFCIFNG